jgi:ureidoglycolate lyase
MTRIKIKAEILKVETFKPFGNVVDVPATRPLASNEALDYWDMVAELGTENFEVGFLVTKQRPFEFKNMERHTKTVEMFIPLKGVSILPVAPPIEVENPNALPPVDKVKAFILDGAKAIIMKKGTWHWAPFPLSETATFTIILRKDTVKDDLYIKDLSETVDIIL